MFDALIDPLQFAIVLLVIVIVVAAARWSTALLPGPVGTAHIEETDGRSASGGE